MTLQLRRIITATALALAASVVTGCSSDSEPSDEAFCTSFGLLYDEMGLVSDEIDAIDEIMTTATGDGDQADLDAIHQRSENILALIVPARGYSETASTNASDPEVSEAIDDITFHTLEIATMMVEEGSDATSLSDFVTGVTSHSDLFDELDAFDEGAAMDLIEEYRDAKCEQPDAE
jgi:hypothetical protein